MWTSYLPWVEYWYNTTYHISTGMTPFQALYGHLPPAITSYKDGLLAVHEVNKQLTTHNELLLHLKRNLHNSINRMKQLADKKWKDLTFSVGDRVLLKLHPYWQQTAFQRAHQKLASHFYGPYYVLEKLGSVAYKLQLPPASWIHPIFHVSLLKPYHHKEGMDPPQTELPPLTEGVVELEPDSILDVRWVKQGVKFIEKCLVCWKYLLEEDATWEQTERLQAAFPNLNLEDKVPLHGGSIDRPCRSRGHHPNPKYMG